MHIISRIRKYMLGDRWLIYFKRETQFFGELVDSRTMAGKHEPGESRGARAHVQEEDGHIQRAPKCQS